MSLRDDVYKSVKHSNLTMALISVLAIVAGVIGFVGVGNLIQIPPQYQYMIGTSKFILRSLGQPQILNSQQVADLRMDQLPLYNVQVVADRVYALDGESFEYTTSNGQQHIVNYYAVLDMKGKALLLRSPAVANEQQMTYSGMLRAPSDDISIDMYNDFTADAKDSNYRLYPFILDATNNPTQWLIAAGVQLALLIGGSIGLGTAVLRNDPSEHPIIKRLARYGDVDSVISEIEDEIASGKIGSVSRLSFTRHWMIYRFGNDMSFIKLEDVMWVYSWTSRSRNSTTHHLRIWDRSSTKLDITAAGKGKDIQAMYSAVVQRAPWTVSGYAKDVEGVWTSEKERFIQSVDQRREKMKQAH